MSSNNHTIQCKNCDENFQSKTLKQIYCSVECKKQFNLKKIYSTIDGKMNVDYVVCSICNLRLPVLNDKHLSRFHSEISYNKYKELYPDSITYPTKLLEKYKHCGDDNWMRTDKGRKLASDRMKGELNINSVSKTTEEQRQQRSPFSKEFYIKRGVSAADAKDKVSKFAKEALKDRVSDTTLEYYLNRGMNESEARYALSKRQTTFSLDICKEKYGEVEGTKVWKERQNKWIKNFKKQNFSKISQVLFWRLYSILPSEFILSNQIYFATLNQGVEDLSGKNNEYRLELKDTYVLPDFLILEKKKIIEFDGVYWHFERTKSQNVKREILRDERICEMGYKVLHINEFDWKTNPEKEIIKCLEFINAN